MTDPPLVLNQTILNASLVSTSRAVMTVTTYISKVELEEAPLEPALFDSHKSYDTSATSPEDAELYVQDQVVGMEPIEEIDLPSPTLRSRLASEEFSLVDRFVGTCAAYEQLLTLKLPAMSVRYLRIPL